MDTAATPNLGTSFPLFHAAPPHLAAHPAGVGLDAGVEPHVPRQHVGPRERPLAHLTRGQLVSLQTSDNTALVTSQRYALEFELLLSVDRD